MKDWRNATIVALLALLAFAAVRKDAAAGEQGGGGDADRGLIAVTGTYGSGASALYLIDTRTRHMAVYRLDNGKKLELVAARDCAYDFMLETYQDQSPPWLTPASLRKSWREFNRQQEGGMTPPAAPEKPAEGPGGASPPPAGSEGR